MFVVGVDIVDSVSDDVDDKALEVDWLDLDEVEYEEVVVFWSDMVSGVYVEKEVESVKGRKNSH